MTTKSKAARILDLYIRLSAGEVIHKDQEAQHFRVTERSVQRDIDELRAYFTNRIVSEGDHPQIVYDRKQQGFVLAGGKSSAMTNSEILAVSKILLDSRAFTKAEMSLILDKMISGCVPYQNMKMVSALLANEKYHYVELSQPSGIQSKLWDLGTQIIHHHLLEIIYQRQDVTQPAVKRTVAPAAILFSEYYFYLHAYIMESDSSGAFHPLYDYPAVFRIDRIQRYQMLSEKFSLPYANRFQEGAFRKRVQFMYGGSLQKITFRYTGTNINAILDRLPTAEIQSSDRNGYTVAAEVYGKGILMWLLSQGASVELLSPPELRQEMQKTLQHILNLYCVES